MNLQRITRALHHSSRLPELAECVRTLDPGFDAAAGYLGLKQFALPRRVRFRQGLEFRLEEFYDLETLWQIAFHHVYPLKPTDAVIIDAGANVGLFTCWAASSNPCSTVIAIEPSSRNVHRLREHLEINRLAGRVTVVAAALAATSEPVWMSEYASASQMHHVVERQMPGAMTVEGITLTEVLTRVAGKRVDFLKMDIEGSEYGVLMHTSADALAAVERLSVEYHEPPAGSGFSKELLARHLRQSGFDHVVDTHPAARYGIVHATRA